MKVTSAKYTDNGSILAVINGVEMTIPDDKANRHRVMISEWEADGNTIEPYKAPLPVLDPLTARQLRLGLVSNGISLSQVEAAIDAIEDQKDKEIAQIEWEYASTFDRHHPLIEQVGGALGLTSEQIDTMWLEALNM